MDTKTFSVIAIGMLLSGEVMAEGTIGGHQYVDLGLKSGLLWATCNLGATTPEALGEYYAWGETSTKTSYDYSSYWLDGKPCHTSDKYKVGGTTELALNHDAAYVNWGESWRMPTQAEQLELISQCTWTWLPVGNKEYDGVAGFKVVGPNGNHIFLPAAGEMVGSSVKHVGIYGNYWNSNLDETDSEKGQYCFFATASKGELFSSPREYGQSVRPVSSGKEVLSVGQCGENAYYKIYGDLSMEIYGSGDIYDYTFIAEPEGATTGIISPSRDSYWQEVKAVTIKDGIMAIGKNAFRNCSKMTSLKVAPSVKYVEVAFNGCTSLTHLYLEDGKDGIKFCFGSEETQDVFFGDCPLEYLYLGRQLSQGTYRCSGTQDDIDYVSFPGLKYYPGIKNMYPPFCGILTLKTVEIGDYVTSLSNLCFSGCPLKGFVFGKNVGSVGADALDRANTGEPLVFPAEVASIGCGLNDKCSAIIFESDYFTFTSHYWRYGYNIFENDGKDKLLPDLYFIGNAIPSSSYYEGALRFNGHTENLYVKGLRGLKNTDDYYADYDPNHDLIIKNLHLEECELLNYAFKYFRSVENVVGLANTAYQCFSYSNIQTVSFAEGIESIANSSFMSSALSSVELPENISSIGACAFEDCTNLKSVVLPSTIESIENRAFSGCTALESFILKCSPLDIDASVFEQVDKSKCTLYVPAGCKRLYQQTPVWKDFLNIVEYEKYYGDANMDGEVNIADVVSIINYLNDKEPEPFDVNNADMNDKNGVNNADLKLLIDKLMKE